MDEVRDGDEMCRLSWRLWRLSAAVVLAAVTAIGWPERLGAMNIRSVGVEYPLGPISQGPAGSLWIPTYSSNTPLNIIKKGDVGLTPVFRNDAAIIAVQSKFGGRVDLDAAKQTSLVGPNGTVDIQTYFRPAMTADGSMWVIDYGNNNHITKIDLKTSALLRINFSRPDLDAGAIVADADGAAVWAILRGPNSVNKIGKILSSGTVEQEIDITSMALSPWDISPGPEGNIWVTDRAGAVLRIGKTGAVTKFNLPNFPGTSLTQYPEFLVNGADGGLWYSGFSTNQKGVVGRVASDGTSASYVVQGQPQAITNGPDGAVWFTEVVEDPRGPGNQYTGWSGYIGRVDAAGNVTEYKLFDDLIENHAGADIQDNLPGIGVGADGTIFVTRRFYQSPNRGFQQQELGYLYQVTPDAVTVTAAPTVTLVTNGTGKGTVKVAYGLQSGTTTPLITLTAVPSAGSAFTAWSANGCLSSSLTCQLVGRGDQTVTATFDQAGRVGQIVRQGFIMASNQMTQSYLRIRNTDNRSGSLYVTLTDAATGKVVNTWQSPRDVPPGVSIQVPVADIEPAGVAASLRSPFYVATVQTTFNGRFQHVLFNGSSSTFTNMTTCMGGTTSDPEFLSFVHSSYLGDKGYPSTISVTNINPDSRVSFSVFDAATGTDLGLYTTDVIPQNGSALIAVADIEAKLGIKPTLLQAYYNLKIQGGINGYIQDVVNSRAAGAMFDMSTYCVLAR